MSNNKQSSIQKLAELIRLTNKEVYAELFDEIEQIKAMHKEEVMQAHYAPKYGCFSEEYYSETFGE